MTDTNTKKQQEQPQAEVPSAQEESIHVRLDKLENEQQKIVRRIDTLQKTVDLLYEDRSILEDIQGSIVGLKEQLSHYRQHQELMNKDIKSEVQYVGNQVESGNKEVKKAVEDNLGGVAEELAKKKTVVVVKESFIQKLLNKFNRKGVSK